MLNQKSSFQNCENRYISRNLKSQNQVEWGFPSGEPAEKMDAIEARKHGQLRACM